MSKRDLIDLWGSLAVFAISLPLGFLAGAVWNIPFGLGPGVAMVVALIMTPIFLLASHTYHEWKKFPSASRGTSPEQAVQQAPANNEREETIRAILASDKPHELKVAEIEQLMGGES